MNELKNGATRSVEADLNIKLVCSEIYGLDVSVHPLSGEQDLNFMVRDVSGEAYVLKISEPASDPGLLKLQNKVLHFLEAGRVGPLSGLHVPRIIPSRRGRKIENLQVRGTIHPVRLLTYLPGRPIARVRPHSSGPYAA